MNSFIMNRRWMPADLKVRTTRSLTLAALAITTMPGALFAQAPPAYTMVGRIPGPANLIEIDGSRGYLVGGKTLTVLDLSNPAAPQKLGSYSFPEKIWGIRVVGQTVYCAADFYGLGIVDVSNPKSPSLRGSIKLPGQAKNVALVGTTALVADHMSGLDIIDVSNAAKPIKKESFFLEGYARDVASIGSMAYAIDAPAGLYTFDLSKQGPVEPVASEQSARAPASIELSKGLAVLVGGGMLQVYDLSKPTAPVKGPTLKTPSGQPVRATLLGSRVFVADRRDGLQVVDLSTPSAPSFLPGFKSPQPARDVAATDQYVYLVVGAAGEDEGEVLVLKRS
jgi:hypothetical protein